MPPNKGIEGFTDDKELSRILAGKELTTSLLTLTAEQGLRLAPQSLIHVTMPPLAFYIWQQLGYLREKSSRLMGGATNYAGIRLPILLPAFIPTQGKLVTHSPVWWRLLHLIWLRQRRRRRNGFLQAVHVADEEQLVSGTDKDTWVDELYPVVIKNLLSPPMARAELPYNSDNFFHQTYATSVPLPAKPVADEPEAEDAGGSTASHIRQNKIPSIYQDNQIQKPTRLRVKRSQGTVVQASWQPEHIYQRWWLGKVWSPLAQRLAGYPVSIKVSSYIGRQGIRWAYAVPMGQRSYVTATGENAEPIPQVAQQLPLPYVGSTPNMAEVTTPGEGTVQTMENYNRWVDLKTQNKLSYSLPDQSEPAAFRTALKRFGRSTILKVASNFKELRFNSLALPRKPISDLLTVTPTLPPAPEIGQAGWSAPAVSLWPEMVERRAEPANVPEDSSSVTHSQARVTGAAPDDVSLGQGLQTSGVEMPLIYRQPPPVAGLPPQPSSATESIYQTPTLSYQQYFKSPASIPPADRIENQDYELSSPRYKDARQPALELLLTSVMTPRMDFNATHRGGSLPPTFEGTDYYGSQPAPELALAPAGRSAEVVSPLPPNREVEVENGTMEAAAPDIDSIARDVYSILKRRLARERERALGLS